MAFQFDYQPKEANGQVIVDERCNCKHVRTEHSPRFSLGHGPCTHFACPCNQFTWVGWVFLKNGRRHL